MLGFSSIAIRPPDVAYVERPVCFTAQHRVLFCRPDFNLPDGRTNVQGRGAKSQRHSTTKLISSKMMKSEADRWWTKFRLGENPSAERPGDMNVQSH